MEVLAAVGLAGNVAQFLEYGITAVRLAYKITNSPTGTSDRLSELESVAKDITATLDTIKTDSQKSGGPAKDETLHRLVERCLELSKEVMTMTDGLKMQKNGRPRFVEGVYRAGLTMYKRKDLEQLSGQLLNLRTQVTSHLIILIEKQQRDVVETLRKFSDSHEKYHSKFENQLQIAMSYLETISKKSDHNTITSGKTARNESTLAQSALHSYIHDVKSFYGEELDILAVSKQNSILESLTFSQLHDRELLIPEAHKRTFEWIFDSRVDLKFADWLRDRNGIFWVAGKAGSGKSSLMRFITEHPTTQKLLSEWASGNITVAKHYFWNPGTVLQKSQEGLLRTCLLQILSTRPHLVPEICKDRWDAPYTDRFSPWTRPQLLKAMRALKTTASDSTSRHLKICLFIDGLDEYEGDHVELVKMLSGIADSSSIKICVSSRPWLDFLDAFDGTPWKLYLQDLTRDDISRYVRDKLEEDVRFQRLQLSADTAASELISDVGIRSEGVFLWVYLVVRSLIRGLRNGDDLGVLRRRLEALPVDLGKFFERMLDSIEDVYRQRTARLFLTLSRARRSFPVLSFFFLNFDGPGPPGVDAPDLTFLKDWPEVDTGYFEVLITKKRQLVAQCKDMIHIAPDPTAPVLFGERVAFLHRTVVDFINTDETYSQLQKLAGSPFDPWKVLFDADLGQAKSLMHLHRLTYIRNHLAQWVLGCFFYATRVELTSSSPSGSVNLGLDELEKTIIWHFQKWGFPHAMFTLLGREDIKSFIDLASRVDLVSYVLYKLPQYTATTLDELAPGWRSPQSIQQHSGFEICPQTYDESRDWRLGRSTGVDRQFQSPADSEKNETLVVASQDAAPVEPEVVDRDARVKRKRKFLRKIVAAFR